MPLSDTLTALLGAAAEQPGNVQRKYLSHGLLLRVKITDGLTTVGISRSDVMPSMIEWRTVLRALPYPIAITPKAGINKDGHYVLWAEWPTPTQSSIESVTSK